MKNLTEKIYGLGMSLKAFCREAGVNITTLTAVDRKTRNIRRSTQVRIEEAYKRLKKERFPK